MTTFQFPEGDGVVHTMHALTDHTHPAQATARTMASIGVGSVSGIVGMVAEAAGASSPTVLGAIGGAAITIGGAFWKWLQYNDKRADRALKREQHRADELQKQNTRLAAENAALKARLDLAE